MVTDDDAELLEDRLIVWKGPPPFDLLKDQQALSIFAQEHHAGTVVLDSLKDIVPDLSKDETGSRYNIARQYLLAAGIDLLELHHLVKRTADGGKPKKLEDVYGSTWITAGAGSVFVLWGEAGDSIVELNHLKQPLEQIGPHKVLHDHHAGRSDLDAPINVLSIVNTSHKGISAKAIATLMFDDQSPKRPLVERARRKLDGLARTGHITRVDGTKGGTNGGDAVLYFPTQLIAPEMP
jgi:hypothetical protein